MSPHAAPLQPTPPRPCAPASPAVSLHQRAPVPALLPLLCSGPPRLTCNPRDRRTRGCPCSVPAPLLFDLSCRWSLRLWSSELVSPLPATSATNATEAGPTCPCYSAPTPAAPSPEPDPLRPPPRSARAPAAPPSTRSREATEPHRSPHQHRLCPPRACPAAPLPAGHRAISELPDRRSSTPPQPPIDGDATVTVAALHWSQ
ncbi:anther-specific proline-rich protein APG-like [Eucalyptus grandis]|uniref:anther-specific proline-rich protein APG-like n=1 Tax=Eucalyptus grandis TaxID=71139 RepID=UPI00192E894D|nr:anther-specific proline-rich protein APG-like [Eucalyptus grandis]